MQDTLQTPIERACAVIGGQAALAEHLHVTPAAVNQWIKGTRPIPATHCPQIERMTNGAVRCEELNDKVDWAYLRAAASPEPQKQNRGHDTPEQIRETESIGMRASLPKVPE